ncbi:hypothetical protein DNU06_05250 [Putridiphycobacter roseus]|uniref:Glycosyltransferase family 4 protein n=1 Tax=Putridiphycobacter roseus TaxID=2219161 RepID=A0A2W1NEY2_9FLAO|nr:glycosyltransferase [Putridiphycobacter roseus]PZE18025.1 hypothetical protein DNU06_05250 [Putridiphycobacter roseus]
MKSKKHVLILPKWYPNETDIQLGIFIQNQAILLSEQFQVSVIYVRGKKQKEKFAVSSNFQNGVQEISVTYQQGNFLSKPFNLLRYHKAQKLGLAALKTPVSLCHVHVPIRPLFLANYLNKHQQIPFCVTEHWSGHLNGAYTKKSFIYKWFYRHALKKAAVLTTVSAKLQTSFLNNTGYPSKVIPNYIQSFPLKHPIKKEGINLISVSDLNNSTKNVTGLLNAFSMALQQNENLILTIIGDGPDRLMVEEKIIALHLKNNVRLLGRFEHSAVLEALPSYQFYICNSNVETFGMTVAEAVLAGLPVICTKCGGPEAFLNKENAILVDTNDTTMLAKSILTMSRQYQNYNHEKNQKDILEKYGKKAITNKWTALYQSILPE